MEVKTSTWFLTSAGIWTEPPHLRSNAELSGTPSGPRSTTLMKIWSRSITWPFSRSTSNFLKPKGCFRREAGPRGGIPGVRPWQVFRLTSSAQRWRRSEERGSRWSGWCSAPAGSSGPACWSPERSTSSSERFLPTRGKKLSEGNFQLRWALWVILTWFLWWRWWRPRVNRLFLLIRAAVSVDVNLKQTDVLALMTQIKTSLSC